MRKEQHIPATPEQSRAARGLLNWTQAELAERADVGLSTVKDFESGKRAPLPHNLEAMAHALTSAGVIFIAENGGGAGVRLAKRAKGKGRTK